jgi:hypothetical protein
MTSGHGRHHASVFETAGDAADHLLSGNASPEEHPAGSSWIATMFAAARQPPRPGELTGEAALVAAMAATARQQLDAVRPGRRSWSVQKKVATLAVSGLAIFATTGVAAAAQGSLPGPTQDFVAHAASHLHLNLPTTGDPPAKDPVRHQPATAHTPAPTVTTTPRPVATSTTTTASNPSTTNTTKVTGTTGPATTASKQTTTDKPPTTPPPKKSAKASDSSSTTTTSPTTDVPTSANAGSQKSAHAHQPPKKEA